MIKYISFENIRKLATSTENQPKEIKLEFREINILCGPNGSGKSTIIDSIRCLKEHHLLPYIPRENMTHDKTGMLTIKLADKPPVNIEFKSDIDSHIMKINKNYIGKISQDYSIHDIISRSLNFHFGNLKIAYKAPSIDLLSNEKFAEVLNKNSSHCIGLLRDGSDKKNAYIGNKEKLYIRLDDDSFPNIISLDAIPSGWKAFASIIIWLEEQQDNTICLIEEPETHLHPYLQRLLIKKIKEIQKSKNLQIFIASHSATFIDLTAWESDEVALFSSDGYTVTNQIDKVKLFSDLGIKPADALQSNGLLWVEGPSDRIYIKHWLHLYAKKNKKKNKKCFIENLHYSFILYGGALMKHYSSSNKDINLEEINKNILFIIDKDLGYESYKEKIKYDKKINKIITEKYTIEDYLPEKFFSKYFKKEDERTKPKSYNKIDLAIKFTEKYKSFYSSYNKNSKLPKFIEEIYNQIARWNM